MQHDYKQTNALKNDIDTAACFIIIFSPMSKDERQATVIISFSKISRVTSYARGFPHTPDRDWKFSISNILAVLPGV
jgi:hypothetical protein